MTRPAPCAVGWADQILAVLANADRPMPTDEIGRRARVIYPGATPLHRRPAGNPGQAARRILTRLAGAGYVLRADPPGARSAHWIASPELLATETEGVALIRAMWAVETVEPRNPPPPIA